MREIDVTSLRAELEGLEGAVDAEHPRPAVVDVRETHEFATGHLPGAVNIPLSEFVDRVGEVTSVPGQVYVVCEVGGRSAQVAAWLGQQGHDVVNVAGGTVAWREAGYPLD